MKLLLLSKLKRNENSFPFFGKHTHVIRIPPVTFRVNVEDRNKADENHDKSTNLQVKDKDGLT